jgi:diacylglycerol kinase (ATP)
VVLFKNKGWYNILRYYLAIITNRVDQLDDIEIFPANHIIIQSEDKAPIQIDGDHYGYLPVTITAVDKPFKLIVPKVLK